MIDAGDPDSGNDAANRAARARHATRRDWLGFASRVAASGTLVGLAYPVARFLQPPAALVSDRVRWTPVCEAAALAPGSARIVHTARGPVIVARLFDGSLHAFSASCTHLGCIVGFDGATNAIRCACHGASFDPRTGTPLDGPAKHPLEQLALQTRDGILTVAS